MNSINFSFDNPWLLLLIIPAIGLALIPYFRIKKKRRRTRNRITSLILHALIIICSVLVLSGLEITRTEQVDSQIVVLKDQSLSTRDVREQIDNYVEEIVDGTSNNSKIGIVAFGYGDCSYTELKRPRDIDVNKFNGSIECDETATDIESALAVARSLFDKDSGAKKRIIMLTDAIETDGNVNLYVDDLAADEIEVNAIFFEPKNYENTRELQINDLELPSLALPNDDVHIDVTIRSHSASTATIKIFDNNKEIDLGSGKNILNLKGGLETFSFTVKFAEDGIHTIRAEVSSDDDLVVENNTFYSYINIDGDQKILVIADGNQKTTDLVAKITDMGYAYDLKTPDQVPNNANALAEYGEVIMMNVNATSLPKGFADELKYYVETLGGSLLTTGGDNTYALGGFEGTTLEELLPVEVEPKANNPRALVIIVDVSNSMFMYSPSGSTISGKPGNPEGLDGTCIDVARKGIIESIENGINPYDYVGIMVFGPNRPDKGVNATKTIIDLTPATHKKEIIAAVQGIRRETDQGSTNYDEVLRNAKSMLDNCTAEVNKKAVVFITDDDGENDYSETFESTIQAMVDDGINFSTVLVAKNISENMGKIGYITGMENITLINNADQFRKVIFDLCKSIPSDTYNYCNGIITPNIERGHAATRGMTAFPEIEEYNGVSAKTKAEVAVEYHNTNQKEVDGEIVHLDNHDPIYAQWDYGLGKVGSVMIDFSGEACPLLFKIDDGLLFVENVITSLYSKEDMTSDIKALFEKHNYTTDMTITLDSTGESVTASASVMNPNGSSEKVDSLIQNGDDFDGSLETMQPGLYEVTVSKNDANGNQISEAKVYTTFSYSKEFNTFYDMQEALTNLGKICEQTGGTVYHSADDIASNIAEMSESEVDLNPQLWLMILALILFLLDICVRKFNFLWPHEIVHKYKEKKAKQQ